jgi:hypothetical protein
MIWLLTVRSPKAVATHKFESEIRDADEFIQALRDWGLAGLQEVNGKIQAVKPLSITVEAYEEHEEPNREVAESVVSPVSSGH